MFGKEGWNTWYFRLCRLSEMCHKHFITDYSKNLNRCMCLLVQLFVQWKMDAFKGSSLKPHIRDPDFCATPLPIDKKKRHLRRSEVVHCDPKFWISREKLFFSHSLHSCCFSVSQWKKRNLWGAFTPASTFSHGGCRLVLNTSICSLTATSSFLNDLVKFLSG